jgi:hypothetical protein
MILKKVAIMFLVFALFVGVDFCYAVDEESGKDKASVLPVNTQVLAKLTSFVKFKDFLSEAVDINITDPDDTTKIISKTATLSPKFNSTVKKRAYINAKEALEAKRDVSTNTKVEIEKSNIASTSVSELQDLLNDAQVMYQLHVAGERTCRTARSAAYQAEVDGSSETKGYFGDYLEKCFDVKY